MSVKEADTGVGGTQDEEMDNGNLHNMFSRCGSLFLWQSGTTDSVRAACEGKAVL